MNATIKHTVPVIPSADINRDIQWYKKHLGFEYTMGQEGFYAVLYRQNHWLHLQWHAGTEEDPILGSVVKFFVDDIEPFLEEMVERESTHKEKLNRNTSWGTHEFGLYDLNKNAIFFVQDA